MRLRIYINFLEVKFIFLLFQIKKKEINQLIFNN